MVDPNVYGFVDYDPKKVSDLLSEWAWSELRFLKYGVDDIQCSSTGDVRFLEQFG